MNRKYTFKIKNNGWVHVTLPNDWVAAHFQFELANMIGEANLSDEYWDAMSEPGQYRMLKSYVERII